MGPPDELLPGQPDLDAMATMPWADGLRQLAAVWADPAREVRRARSTRFEFVPELPPGFDPRAHALDDDELETLVMPHLDGLGHGADWTTPLRRRCPSHAQLLLDVTPALA